MDTSTCTPVSTATCFGSTASRTSVAPVSGRVRGAWLRGPVPAVLASAPAAQSYALVMDIDVTDHTSVIAGVFEGTRGPSAWSPPT